MPSTAFMGILNVTPDSFSDGGRYLDTAAAVARAVEMEQEGADIIDVGGESTRPGSERVTEAEELARVEPVLAALRGKLTIPISIDTLHPGVAARAVQLGAAYINHIALDGEDARTSCMAKIARDSGVHLILTHARGPLEHMHKLPPMADAVGEVLAALGRFKTLAAGASLLLDPGIGFGKDAAESYALLRAIPQIRALGCPIVIGTSRKRFLSQADLAADRDFATAATVAYCVEQQCDIVRVHNVKAMVKVAEVTKRLYL